MICLACGAAMEAPAISLKHFILGWIHFHHERECIRWER